MAKGSSQWVTLLKVVTHSFLSASGQLAGLLSDTERWRLCSRFNLLPVSPVFLQWKWWGRLTERTLLISLFDNNQHSWRHQTYRDTKERHRTKGQKLGVCGAAGTLRSMQTLKYNNYCYIRVTNTEIKLLFFLGLWRLVHCFINCVGI